MLPVAYLARNTSLPLWYVEMLLVQEIIIVSKIYDASRCRFSTFHGRVKNFAATTWKDVYIMWSNRLFNDLHICRRVSWRSHGLTSSNPSSHIGVRDLKPHITGNAGKSGRRMPYFLHNTHILMHSAYKSNALRTFVRLYSVLTFIRLQLLVVIRIVRWLSDYRRGLDW
jgi:hypothetical protein